MRVLVGVSMAWLMACEEETLEGACSVQRFPVPGTSYSETDSYCASQSACASYCTHVAGRSDTGHCGFDPAGFCGDGALPAAPPEEHFCAVNRSIACGGADDFQPHCDGYSCELVVESVDYDPGTGCTTRIGSARGTGQTCEEALADLRGDDGDEAALCPVDGDDSPFDACSKQACCSELVACQADEACVALVGCVTPCTDQACFDRCGADHPDGIAAYNAAVSCINDNCE